MRPALRKIGSLLLAVVIVTGAVGAPVGTAQAAASDCTIGDLALGGLYTFLNPEDTCGLYNDKEAKKDHAEAYKEAQAIEQQKSTYSATLNNLRNSKQGPAWSEGKIEVVNSMNNGSNVSVANDNFNRSVRNYYVPNLRNIFAHYSAVVIQAEDEWLQNESRVEVPHTDRTMEGTARVRMKVGTHKNGTPVHVYFRTFVFSEPNADGVLQYDAAVPDEMYSNWAHWNTIEVVSANVSAVNNNESKVGIVIGQASLAYTAPPGSGESDIRVIDSQAKTEGDLTANGGSIYAYQIEKLHVQYSLIKDNGKPYVENVYQSYNEGEIDSGDLLNPTDLSSRTATQYNETGQKSFVAAELANLGVDGDLNHSVTLNHTVNGNSTVREGTLFYTGDDVTGWNTSETYNMSNLNGMVYLAVQNSSNESAVYTYTTGEITIESAQNPDTGEEVTNVSMQSYRQESTNATELREELSEMRELQEEYEQAVESLTIGGAGLPSAPEAPESPLQDILPALAIGGLILFAVSQRS